MKKMIVPVVIGLVIGLGGSMAARMLFAKEPASLEETLAAAIGEEAVDSTSLLDTEAAPPVMASADSTAPADAAEPLHGPAVAETTHVSGHPSGSAPFAGGGAAAPSNPTSADLPEGALTSAGLAKLFASMQARDAAKVLEKMEDYEVQVILGALGNREAAAILSSLPPERAAGISRAVILGERGVR